MLVDGSGLQVVVWSGVECSAVGCVATVEKISIFMGSLVSSNNVGTHVDYCSLSLEKVGSVYHLI